MAEPVTLIEAKAQCRMSDDNSEDTFITSLIAPARAYVEKVSTYSLVSGSRVFTFSGWGDFLEIFLRPITSVTSVGYIDADGNAATHTDYLAPIGIYPFRIFRGVTAFPTIMAGSSITVTVAVGAIGSSTQEYLIAKRAILLLIGHWFENREAVVVGSGVSVSSEIDLAVRSLLNELAPVSAY